MIKLYHIRFVSGTALVLMGALALLQTSGMLSIPEKISGLLFAALLAGIGLLFLAMVRSGASTWWAVFPGSFLLATAAAIVQGIFFSPFAWLGGALFLGILGLSFAWVYLAFPAHWWAIIPGGALLTLAAVSLGDHFTLFDPGTLLFRVGSHLCPGLLFT